MQTPNKGEADNLDYLSKLYMPRTPSQMQNPMMQPQQPMMQMQNPMMQPQQPMMQPQQPMIQPQQPMMQPQQPMMQPQQPMMQPQQPMMQPQQPMIPQQMGTNYVNQYQFNILKNKLDTIQLELIDIVRHLKNYAKRYMAAVREDDMTKIDSYIRDLIKVDKNMQLAKKAIAEEKQIREQAEEVEEDIEEKGTIAKATDGMKNVISGFTRNVGAIRDIVKNTSDAANNFLQKNIIPTSKASDKKKGEEKIELGKESEGKPSIEIKSNSDAKEELNMSGESSDMSVSDNNAGKKVNKNLIDIQSYNKQLIEEENRLKESNNITNDNNNIDNDNNNIDNDNNNKNNDNNNIDNDNNNKNNDNNNKNNDNDNIDNDNNETNYNTENENLNSNIKDINKKIKKQISKNLRVGKTNKVSKNSSKKVKSKIKTNNNSNNSGSNKLGANKYNMSNKSLKVKQSGGGRKKKKPKKKIKRLIKYKFNNIIII